jgi:hypothetical protein
MTNAPIPCAHCGTNFMRRDLNPDAPKLCNNCEYNNKQKEQNRINNKEKNASEIQFLFTCDRKTQIEIEEYCMNEGISISQYFIRLHQAYQHTGVMRFCGEEAFEKLKKMTENFHGKLEWLPDDLKGVHEQFESMAHEGEPSLKVEIPMSVVEQEKKDVQGFGKGKYKLEHKTKKAKK